MSAAGAPGEQPGWGLFTELRTLVERRDRRFVPLTPSAYDALQALEPQALAARANVWNMQRNVTLGSLREGHDLTRRSLAKGVQLRLVVPAYVVDRRCRLLSSYDRTVRVAPVPHPMMVLDGRRVVVGDASGESMWMTGEKALVARAVQLFEQVWSSATPALRPGEEPPFTPRMVEIAFRLVEGATDREIARDLGVSERTVSSDVREMGARLGARSRPHAIALLAGVSG